MAIEYDKNASGDPNAGQNGSEQQSNSGADQNAAGTTQKQDGQVQGEVQTLEGGAQLTKLQDGTYRLVLTPDDPNSSIYTGKDKDEVFINLAKGKAEADKMLADYRSEPDDDDDDSDVVVPDEQRLRLDLAGRNGVDPKFLNFTDEQWDEYERDHSAARTAGLIQKVEAIKQAAHQQVAQAQNQNELVEINGSVIDEETEQVEQMLKDYGIEAASFERTYRQVIREVTEDDKSYKNGVLKPGVITYKAAKAMREQITKSDRQRLEQEIAEKNRLLRQNGGGGNSSAGFSQGVVPHKSSEDVVEYLKAHPEMKPFG